MKAMQFESVAPVKTACGLYKAYVKLDGEQPVTTMRIVRENEKGGSFFAPISVNIKMTFEPVGRVTTEALELRKSLRFPPARHQEWSAERSSTILAAANGVVKVDTDGDRIPDTFLPGLSNFAAGKSPRPQKLSGPQSADRRGLPRPGRRAALPRTHPVLIRRIS